MPIFPSVPVINEAVGEPAHRPGVLYDALSTTLQRRKACEAPLKMLCISHFIITTNRTNDLGKLVSEFLSNGGEGLFDELTTTLTTSLTSWAPKIGGETILSVPHKPSGSGGRTIWMGSGWPRALPLDQYSALSLECRPFAF